MTTLFFLWLQNIFQGKDIREQLPAECKEFEEASCTWKTIMSRLHKENKALQGTHQPGMTAYFEMLLFSSCKVVLMGPLVTILK